ncbi:MAG: hypothetical protein ABJF50_06645 [Paracoccaceae bacterium]
MEKITEKHGAFAKLKLHLSTWAKYSKRLLLLCDLLGTRLVQNSSSAVLLAYIPGILDLLIPPSELKDGNLCTTRD